MMTEATTQRSDTGTDDDIAEKMMEVILAGGTIKDIQGVSDDMMEGIYAFAHRFYHDGRLDDAETFFRFLCLYDFYNAEYALGLGAVLQMKRKYQRAIDTYALAYALSRNDLRSMLQAGQCNLSLKRLEAARCCFERVVDSSTDNRLVERARAYLDAIEISETNIHTRNKA